MTSSSLSPRWGLQKPTTALMSEVVVKESDAMLDLRAMPADGMCCSCGFQVWEGLRTALLRR